MNLIDKFSELEINPKVLNEKKQQTDKKIEYVRDYVNRWAEISSVRNDVNVITFIDCMSNAGVYKDGDCCTAIEVLAVFCDIALRYPSKLFRIICNDNDSDKVKILNKVVRSFHDRSENISFFTANLDVNICLDNLLQNPQFGAYRLFGYGCSTILYVDPFDFGTVQIPKISAILKAHYCELIFNFFISDYVRNMNKDKGRIQKCLGGKTVSDKDTLIAYMRSMLKVGKIKHLFSYQFRISNNVELYQIIFATPNIRGLEVLKESLWKVFNGDEYHRNRYELDQISFFSVADDKEAKVKMYAGEAQDILRQQYAGQELSFDEVEVILIENTMLGESHIIKYVLKPMIENGIVTKCGLVHNKNNYKQDRYMISDKGGIW